MALPAVSRVRRSAAATSAPAAPSSSTGATDTSSHSGAANTSKSNPLSLHLQGWEEYAVLYRVYIFKLYALLLIIDQRGYHCKFVHLLYYFMFITLLFFILLICLCRWYFEQPLAQG